MSKRENTVRLSLAGAALTLFAGLWGALYQHDQAVTDAPEATQPVALADTTLPVAVAPQGQAQASTQPAPVTQPVTRVHTRTRAS